MFYPDLTAIIQPLSGEYAVRRDVLEAIPFPIGYGVETSHLIDVYSRWGMEAFAQTDLDQRVHRNQATVSLGKMAFGILQTFFKRTSGVVDGMPELKTVLRQFQVKENEYDLIAHDIVEFERPPMVEIPEYQQRPEN